MNIKFIDKKHEAGNAWSYRFSNDEKVVWIAGQYQRWELPGETVDKNDKEHWFTISAAPSEVNFQITTRNSGSAFKTKLDSLETGDEIVVDTLEGDFIWTETIKPKIFIAGGIGITPLRSMLVDRHNKSQKIGVHLIYANRDEDFVFRSELEDLLLTHPEFSVSFIVGMLDTSVIRKDVPDLNDKFLYLSGPDPMVEAIGKELKDSGLSEDQLKQDWFPGYDEKNF